MLKYLYQIYCKLSSAEEGQQNGPGLSRVERSKTS